jgi:hypothetical protein
MATYKEIVGTAVTNIAGDSPTTVDGDIWYNSSATNFKFNVTTSFTGWATGGNLTTSRYGGRSWMGTMQEIILYNEANNPNRTGIETNINTEYTIY